MVVGFEYEYGMGRRLVPMSSSTASASLALAKETGKENHQGNPGSLSTQ